MTSRARSCVVTGDAPALPWDANVPQTDAILWQGHRLEVVGVSADSLQVQTREFCVLAE